MGESGVEKQAKRNLRKSAEELGLITSCPLMTSIADLSSPEIIRLYRKLNIASADILAATTKPELVHLGRKYGAYTIPDDWTMDKRKGICRCFSMGHEL